MGLKYFWYLEGIQGDSADPRYAGQIDITGFSFDSVTGKAEGLGFYGKEIASPYKMTLLKRPDKASNAIVEAIVKCRTFAHSVITLDRNGGNFTKLVMDDVELLACSRQESVESVSIDFKKILLVNG